MAAFVRTRLTLPLDCRVLTNVATSPGHQVFSDSDCQLDRRSVVCREGRNMLATASTFFAIGIPHACSGDHADASWFSAGFFFFFVFFVPLFALVRLAGRSVPGQLSQLPSAKICCDYCGRENDENTSNCVECGTPFPVPEFEFYPFAGSTFGLILR